VKAALAILAWGALLGFVGGAAAYLGAHHGILCCKQDQFPLLHEHPPHDALGMAQQEGRGAYGASHGTTEQNESASACIDHRGVPLWIYHEDGVTTLSCAPGNIYGETH